VGVGVVGFGVAVGVEVGAAGAVGVGVGVGETWPVHPVTASTRIRKMLQSNITIFFFFNLAPFFIF